MRVIRKGKLLRPGLALLLLGMLVCVGVMIFSLPGIQTVNGYGRGGKLDVIYC